MAKPLSATVKAALIGAAALIVATVLTLLWPGAEDQAPGSDPATDPPIESFESLVLDSRFFPSGWMGDGEHGEKYVKLEPISTDVDGEQGMALRIQYSAGPEGWAGVYWQYPDGNWGDQPGLSLEGAREIVFLARGVNGGEVVEFKSGGIRGRYSDSFEKSLGNVALTNEWRGYRLDLEGEDLSHVIGAFAWVAPASTGEVLSFWLADIQIR